MNDTHVNESILSEEILEDQKKNRINHMEYLPGMENIGSEIMDKVVSEMNNYDYDKYTEYDVKGQLTIMKEALKILKHCYLLRHSHLLKR